MAKFCGRCGAKLDESTGICPNCDDEKQKNAEKQEALFRNDNESEFVSEIKLNRKEIKKQKKAAKREARKAKRAGWSWGKKIRRFILKFLLAVILLVLLFAGVAGTLVYFDVVPVSIISELLDVTGLKPLRFDSSEEISYENYRIEPPDSDEYFGQTSQVTEEIDVNDSDETLTETQAIARLTERGFCDIPVYTEYNMDGEYSDAYEISESSSTKHPVYETYYVTEKNELWIVMIINGDIMAIPVSYNLQSDLDVQMVISESVSVTSYASSTNKFYKNVPNESVMIVKVIEKIDAKTLESLVIEAIDVL